MDEIIVYVAVDSCREALVSHLEDDETSDAPLIMSHVSEETLPEDSTDELIKSVAYALGTNLIMDEITQKVTSVSNARDVSQMYNLLGWEVSIYTYDVSAY
jgi:hypothetical protein